MTDAEFFQGILILLLVIVFSVAVAIGKESRK